LGEFLVQKNTTYTRIDTVISNIRPQKNAAAFVSTKVKNICKTDFGRIEKGTCYSRKNTLKFRNSFSVTFKP